MAGSHTPGAPPGRAIIFQPPTKFLAGVFLPAGGANSLARLAWTPSADVPQHSNTRFSGRDRGLRDDVCGLRFVAGAADRSDRGAIASLAKSTAAGDACAARFAAGICANWAAGRS